MSGYTLADALRDMRGYKERADKAESELAALRAELAAMTARAERAEALLGQILDAARRVVDCHTERPAETGQAIADMYDVLLDVENNEDGQP